MKDDHITAQNNADQTTPNPRASATPAPAANRRKAVKGVDGDSKRPRGTTVVKGSTGAETADKPARKTAGTLDRDRVTTRSLPDTFADERDDVLAVINELEDQLDRYEEIRESLERELTEANQRNQAAKQHAQELEWQMVTLQTRVEALDQMRQETALLEEEIADVNANAQRLAEQLSQSEKECARLNGELKTVNKQLEEFWSVRKERDGLRVDIKNTRAKLDQIERALTDALEDRKALQAKLQETQLGLEDTRSTKHQLEADLRAADDRNEELRRLQDEVQQKLETLRAEKKTLQAQLTHMERENGRLIEQQQFYDCELTSLRSMNRNAESALANVKKAFSEVRIALAETKARARRRAIETWPRVSGTLRGVHESQGADGDPEIMDAAAVPSIDLAGVDPGRGVADDNQGNEE